MDDRPATTKAITGETMLFDPVLTSDAVVNDFKRSFAPVAALEKMRRLNS